MDVNTPKQKRTFLIKIHEILIFITKYEIRKDFWNGPTHKPIASQKERKAKTSHIPPKFSLLNNHLFILSLDNSPTFIQGEYTKSGVNK